MVVQMRGQFNTIAKKFWPTVSLITAGDPRQIYNVNKPLVY
jgi:hypothetical protein